MVNKVKIIIQSDYISGYQIVKENKAERFLKTIRDSYVNWAFLNKEKDPNFKDSGLRITTSLIKE
jgi:hypothetical protein